MTTMYSVTRTVFNPERREPEVRVIGVSPSKEEAEQAIRNNIASLVETRPDGFELFIMSMKYMITEVPVIGESE